MVGGVGRAPFFTLYCYFFHFVRTTRDARHCTAPHRAQCTAAAACGPPRSGAAGGTPRSGTAGGTAGGTPGGREMLTGTLSYLYVEYHKIPYSDWDVMGM